MYTKSYQNDQYESINIKKMSASQEEDFVNNYTRFGRDDAADNWNILGVKDFDGIKPNKARVSANINDAYELTDCDAATRKAAREAYISGWGDWCESSTADYAVWAKSEKALHQAFKKLGVTDYTVGDPDNRVASAELSIAQVCAIRNLKSVTEISEL